MKAHLEKLKDFDAYYKPIEDYHERTFIGGTVSILCWVTIIVLMSLRCYEFFTVKEIRQSIFVDSSRNPKLTINLDIVIPHISCHFISLDAMDSSGEQHLHIDHNVYKRRLDSNGVPIEEPKKEEIGAKVILKAEAKPNTTSTEAPKCGSCYGAEDSNNHDKLNITCCNTCEDVKEAYRKRRWQGKESDFEQCKSTPSALEMKQVFSEGCQVYGYLEVNRVSGSFHLAPGKSFTIDHDHIHDIKPFSSSQFNTSHIIKHLSFGETKLFQDSNLPLKPLDGTFSIANEGATAFSYYIKIVPTMIVNENNEIAHTSQFSVTKHSKAYSSQLGDNGMPGIFVSYGLSALMVKIASKSTSVTHLVTDLCSIIGGVWMFSMAIDTIFYRSSKLINKMELGKAS